MGNGVERAVGIGGGTAGGVGTWATFVGVGVAVEVGEVVGGGDGTETRVGDGESGSAMLSGTSGSVVSAVVTAATICEPTVSGGTEEPIGSWTGVLDGEQTAVESHNIDSATSIRIAPQFIR